jgi:glycine reductase
LKLFPLALCSAVQSQLGIPVITGMSEENPGVDLYRDALYIVDSGVSISKMRDVLLKMAKLGKKLVDNEIIGLPDEEGYLRRGLLRDQLVDKKAGTRLVDMLLAKVNGEPFESEMLPTSFEPVPMPAAVKDLSKAKVMLITDGGLVPKGNPDRIEGTAATRWGSYNIEGRSDLEGEEYEVSHGGYDTRFVQEDPDRLVPLDVMRELEKSGVIGKLHDEFISTCGRSNPLSNTRRLGREMVEKIKKEGIDAVILTST